MARAGNLDVDLDRHQARYRRLLRLYPRSFREDYGEPMAQLFADTVRHEGTRAWRRAVRDLLRTVPSSRIEALMNRFGTGSRVAAVALLVLAACAVGLGTGAGVGVVPVVALAVAGVLIGRRQLVAAMPFGDRAPLRHALAQAWWAPVAGLVGLGEVLMGVGTIFEAHNLGGRIFGSAVLLAFGGAMFLGLARRPFERAGGNILILLATIPGLLLFWLIVPPVLALVVWVGVLSSGFEPRPVTPGRA